MNPRVREEMGGEREGEGLAQAPQGEGVEEEHTVRPRQAAAQEVDFCWNPTYFEVDITGFG